MVGAAVEVAGTWRPSLRALGRRMRDDPSVRSGFIGLRLVRKL